MKQALRMDMIRERIGMAEDSQSIPEEAANEEDDQDVEKPNQTMETN